MTDEELDEMEKRAASATEGPWTHADADLTSDVTVLARVTRTVPTGSHGLDVLDVLAEFDCFHSYSQDEINAKFVAHARSDVPALVAEVRALSARLLEREGVINDMLLDGYERSRAGRYRRALEDIVAMHNTPPGVTPLEEILIAREALREDDDE